MLRAFIIALSLVACAQAADATMPVTAEAAAKSVSPAPLTRQQFVDTLGRELADHFRLEGDFQLELLRAWASPAKMASDWQIVVTEYPTLAASAMILRCRTVADGVAGNEETISVRASLWRDAWVTRQPINNGAAFDVSLLDTRRVDSLRERDALPATVGDSSFQFSRSVPAGRVLGWRDISRRPLVRKGDKVDVTATDGALVINMQALAMESGAQGDAITVRNTDSQKNFTAFVVDTNHVQVRF